MDRGKQASSAPLVSSQKQTSASMSRAAEFQRRQASSERCSIYALCLTWDNLGRLIPREKIRTKKKVIKTIVDRMEQCADDGLDYSGKCYISQSGCVEDAKEVAKLVEERFPKLNGKVEINYVGTTIGSHTGPGTVALFFWGAERGE